MELKTDVGQLPEIIYIDDALYSLYTMPLAPWLRAQDPPIVFDQRSITCQRGYVGKWRIEGGRLSLIGLYGWRDGKYTSVIGLFGQRDVFADWFTGPLKIEPTTEAVREGEYPKAKTMLIQAGQVIEGPLN